MAVGAPVAEAPAVPWAKRTRRALRARLLLGLFALAGALPFGVARALGRWGGTFAYIALGRERRRALEHLALAFPEQAERERKAIAKASFRHLGECAAELAQIRRLDARLERFVELPADAEAVLKAALDEGKGAVIVTGHVGNWELLARRVAKAGYRLSVVARELNAPQLTDAMDAWRGAGGVVTLWRGRAGATKQMLRVFRENGILGLLIDQDTRVQSVFVPFFGRDAATPRAAGDLAVRTGAPLLASFIRRTADGHRISFERIEAPRTGDRDTDGVALTAAATLAIERAIRAAPAEWVWMHPRWKTRPSDTENLR